MEFEQAVAQVMRALATRSERRYSHRTITGYERNLRRLNREIPGGLMQPTERMITALSQWRTAQTRRRDADEITDVKITCDVAALRWFYDLLTDRGYSENPARRIKGGKRSNGLPRPMPLALVQQLANAIPTDTADGLRDRVMIDLMLHGLRNFEVGALHSGSVSLDADTVVLHVDGKGDKPREIVLHPQSFTLFAVHLLRTLADDAWAAWIVASRAEYPSDSDAQHLRRVMEWLYDRRAPKRAPLFRTQYGTQCTVRWTNEMFVKYRRRAGLSTEWGPHSLRHTCATEMLNAGNDIAVVSQWLGHENIETTMIYTKILTPTKLNAISRLTLPTTATMELTL